MEPSNDTSSTIALSYDVLLMLPCTSSEYSMGTFDEAYGNALSATLKTMAVFSKDFRSIRTLDVAIEIDYRQASGSLILARTKQLCEMVYALIARGFSQSNLDPEDSGYDIRVFAITTKGQSSGSSLAVGEIVGLDKQPQHVLGPVLDFKSLATSRKPWKRIMAPEGDQTSTLLKSFAGYREQVSGVPSYDIHRIPGTPTSEKSTDVSGKHSIGSHHSTVAVGGTFDHFHLGHQLLLTILALVVVSSEVGKGVCKRLIVGITGDELLKNKKFHEFLESWDQRQAAVAKFLNVIVNVDRPFNDLPARTITEAGPNGHAVHYELASSVRLECVKIADAFGPTITDETISALVISGETRSGGKAVNDRREGLGWAPLEIIEVDVLDAQVVEEASGAKNDDFANKISSTAIRQRLAEKKAEEVGKSSP